MPEHERAKPLKGGGAKLRVYRHRAKTAGLPNASSRDAFGRKYAGGAFLPQWLFALLRAYAVGRGERYAAYRKEEVKVQLATLKGADLVKRNRLENEIPLKPRDVAVYCQVSKSTVLKWIKDDKLKAFKLPSGHYRVDKEDFRSFLERYNMPIKKWFFESVS